MNGHLIFASGGTRYALPAGAVRATVRLPGLSPVEDLPEWFVGLMDLHGEVVPVLDLVRRLGHPERPWRLDQAVILLEQDGLRVGLIADEVLDLIEVGPEALAPYVRLTAGAPSDSPAVIAGTLRWADGVLILLDPQALLSPLPCAVPAPAPTGATASPPGRTAHLSPDERQRLAERTRRLARPPDRPAVAGRLYALVQIGTAGYAIDLEQVAEFARLGPCTPIPCCPPQVLGCLNQRGVILTVLDLAPLLQGTPRRDYGHLVVLRLRDLLLGLAVHAILDICPGGDADLTSTAGPAYGHRHCRWMLKHPGGVAGVLDPEAMLAQGLLDVDERV